MKKRFVIATLLIGWLTNASFSQQPYQKPLLEQKGSWCLIVVPDLQNYAKWGRNQPIMDLMMAWIADNIDTLNIKMVMGMGDLVENNEKITTDFDGDQTTQSQWQAVAKAFAKLDGKVPYIAATGNHDYSTDKAGVRTTHYSEFFTPDKNHLNQKLLVQNTRNVQGQPTLENSAYEIKGLNGRDYLFMTVEDGPRDTVLSWAKKMTALEQYRNHRVVLSTHEYLDAKDVRTSEAVSWLYWEPYNVNNEIQKSARIILPQSNNGKQIWEKLVAPSSNIELVLCGHISGEGYRVDKNGAGKPVHQVLFDAQSMGGGQRYGNGGDGWLRILEFFPDGKTVRLKTFSPLFGASPTTRQFAYKKDSRNDYKFSFE